MSRRLGLGLRAGAAAAAAQKAAAAADEAADPAAAAMFIDVFVCAQHRGVRPPPRGRLEGSGVALTFEEATAPRPYLVVACSYPGAKFELRGVRAEAAQVAEPPGEADALHATDY